MFGKQWYGGDAGDGVESFYGDPMGLALFFASSVGETVITAVPLFTGFGSGVLTGDTNLVVNPALRLVQTGVSPISGETQFNSPVGISRLVSMATAMSGETLLNTPLGVIRQVRTAAISGESQFSSPVGLTRFLRSGALSGDTEITSDPVLRFLGFADISGDTVIVVGTDAIFEGNYFALTDPSRTGADRDSYAQVGILT